MAGKHPNPGIPKQRKAAGGRPDMAADAWEEAMMRAMGGRAACSERTYEAGASRPSAPRKSPESDDAPAKTSKKARKTKLPAGAGVDAKRSGRASAQATLKQYSLCRKVILPMMREIRHAEASRFHHK